MTTTLKFNKQYMVVPRGLNMCSRYAVIYGKKEHCLSQVSSKWHFYHTWSFSITSSLLHTSYLVIFCYWSCTKSCSFQETRASRIISCQANKADKIIIK